MKPLNPMCRPERGNHIFAEHPKLTDRCDCGGWTLNMWQERAEKKSDNRGMGAQGKPVGRGHRSPSSIDAPRSLEPGFEA